MSVTPIYNLIEHWFIVIVNCFNFLWLNFETWRSPNFPPPATYHKLTIYWRQCCFGNNIEQVAISKKISRISWATKRGWKLRFDKIEKIELEVTQNVCKVKGDSWSPIIIWRVAIFFNRHMLHLWTKDQIRSWEKLEFVCQFWEKDYA